VGYVNGGIVATLLDCHGGACVVWEVHQRGLRNAEGEPLHFITAGFDVHFLRPTPLGPTVRLSAEPEAVAEDEVVVRSDISVDDKVRATMTATWRRYRPR
jgi:acyl-coenzyme A thioesterase PaaI-like protein